MRWIEVIEHHISLSHGWRTKAVGKHAAIVLVIELAFDDQKVIQWRMAPFRRWNSNQWRLCSKCATSYGEQKLLENMLQLFVMQQMLTLVDTYGSASSKLQQMLAEIGVGVCWAECVVWRGKGNVAARFVHRGVCG